MKNKPLLQISLHISPESEEATTVLLEEILGQPPSIYTDAETQATTATVYLSPADWTKALRAKIKSALSQIKQCGLDIGSGKITARKLRHENWAESWKRHFKPIVVGRALLIKPSWSQRRPRKGQAVVVLDPGLSFGTGQHATTSFCLQQIVQRAWPANSQSRTPHAAKAIRAPQSFLDIGTGSGILALAAAKLGYAPIHAFDFDPESVRVSRENAQANQVAALIQLSQQDLCKLPLRSKAKFDLICANLIYDLLLAEAPKIVSRLAPSGRLVLAGILQTQFAQVRAGYECLGLELIESSCEKEWQSGLFVFNPGANVSKMDAKFVAVS